MAQSRAFAYNLTQSQFPVGSTGIGNIAVESKNFTPGTGGLKWWNGPSEDNGYILCHTSSDRTAGNLTEIVPAPTIGFWRTANKTEASFVQFVNDSFSQSTEWGVSAKSYLEGIGIFTTWGQIPYDVVVHLDSNDIQSYPATGSTWYDLSGNLNHATLINGPTFSDGDNGSLLQFHDNSLQWASIEDIGDLNQWTVEVAFRLTQPLTNKITAIVTGEFDLVNKLNFSIGTNNAPANKNICVGFFDGSWHNTSGFIPNLNQWYHVVGTYDGQTIRQFVNGTASGGTLNYTGTPQSGGKIRIMRRWDTALNATELVDGDLGVIRIYSRAITESEVYDCYTRHTIRFGY